MFRRRNDVFSGLAIYEYGIICEFCDGYGISRSAEHPPQAVVVEGCGSDAGVLCSEANLWKIQYVALYVPVWTLWAMVIHT